MSSKLGPFKLNQVYCIDCVKGMRKLPESSIGAIVTDPPYGLEFMGKEWDRFKKVGHWDGKRGKQAHKDAYGRIQGTCPSIYRTKRLTNPQGAYEHKKGFRVLPRFFAEDRDTYQGWTQKWATEALRVLKPGGYLLAMGGTRTYHRMACGIEDAGFRIRDCLVWGYAQGFPKSYNISKGFDRQAGRQGKILSECASSWGNTRSDHNWGMVRTMHKVREPVTSLARKWQGWGTGLKPSWDPIVMAQKPVEKNYCHNVKNWGVGGLNIEACRIPFESKRDVPRGGYGDEVIGYGPFDSKRGARWKPTTAKGRHPANTIRTNPFHDNYDKFFMIPKPSKKEKSFCSSQPFNHHPTVKPIRLMVYLIKLVTPPGQILLDPFAGSCTTGMAANILGVKFLLFEKENTYCEISRKRLGKS